jgi:hypothetical protein
MASEYGLTIKQYGDMTAREVFICMSNISKRKNDDMIIQAKLHGMEIKNGHKEKMLISKEQDDFLSGHLERINKERFSK